MKTVQEMVDKAVSIADSDTNAVVGFFGHFNSYAHHLSVEAFRNGVYKCQGRTYQSNEGGKVFFFNENTTYIDICGFQFSHVFLLSGMLSDPMHTVTRIRSPYKHKEPIGIFRQFDGFDNLESKV